MKKILAFLLACVMLLSFLVSCDDTGDTAGTGNGGDQSGSGEEEKPEANPASDFEYRIENGEVIIEDFKGKGTSVVIPQTIEGYPVTAIGENACHNHDYIKSLYISDTVKTVGKSAFAFCNVLKEVRFGNHLQMIDREAFQFCTALEKIILPSSVKTIRGGAFDDCNSVKEVFIPKGIEEWDKSFCNLNSLETLTLEEGLTFIPELSFSYLSNLRELTFPASITSVSMLTFVESPNLASVTFLGNAPEITFGAFCEKVVVDGKTRYVKRDNITFYYKKGTTGWTDPALDEYTKVEID